MQDREYDASDEIDLAAFVKRIGKLSERQLRWFLAATINAGLMNLTEDSQDDLAKIFATPAYVGNRDAQEDVVTLTMMILPIQSIGEAFQDLVDHILQGEDKVDSENSVGGWCQNELTLATGLLRYAETIESD